MCMVNVICFSFKTKKNQAKKKNRNVEELDWTKRCEEEVYRKYPLETA